jgi:hypothetical protein
VPQRSNGAVLLEQVTRFDAKRGGDALEGVKLKVRAASAFDVVPRLATAEAGALCGILLREAETFAEGLHLRDIEGHAFKNGNHRADTLAVPAGCVHTYVDR